jgi:hypothetical protein
MTAAKILSLIETVELGDAARLDEIDALVYCYAHKCRVEEYSYKNRSITFWRFDESAGVELPASRFHDGCGDLENTSYPYYTRSRDALKSIRPEGWQFVIDVREGNASVCFARDCDNQKLGEWFTSPTEELAELHAIIQAIAFESGETHG